jgi:hypothetical protein
MFYIQFQRLLLSACAVIHLQASMYSRALAFKQPLRPSKEEGRHCDYADRLLKANPMRRV